MSPVVQIVLASCGAFVSTNLDTFWLLVAVHPQSGRGARAIPAGYVAATFLVSSLAWLASAGLEILPPRQIDYLGLIPLAMGVYRAWALFGRPSDPVASRASAPTFSGVFAMTLAQSVDNFAVLASLFADTRTSLEPVVVLTIAVCALAWSGLAHWVGNHRLVAPRLRRIARFLLPALLVAVGLHLLADTEVDQPEPASVAAAAASSGAP